MTAERIASYINGLGFLTAFTDSNVTITVSQDIPLLFNFEIGPFGVNADEFSDMISTFVAGLDEHSLYALTLEQRIGLDPTHISNLDLEDFQVIMASGQLEKARKDVRNTMRSACKLAQGAEKLAQSPEFMETVHLPLTAQIQPAALSATA